MGLEMLLLVEETMCLADTEPVCSGGEIYLHLLPWVQPLIKTWDLSFASSDTVTPHG
jgi:hypothetical protein